MTEQFIVAAAVGAGVVGILLFVVGPIVFGRVLKRNHEERLKVRNKRDDDSA